MEPRAGSAEHSPQAPQPEQWVASGANEYAPPSIEQPERPKAPLEQPQQASRVEMQAVPPPTAGAASLPAPQTDDDSTAQSVTSDAPLVAGDEDVIEKEWVDKAKKIIAETKDDPYQREQQIKKLQIDYLRKRYGREIGERTE